MIDTTPISELSSAEQSILTSIEAVVVEYSCLNQELKSIKWITNKIKESIYKIGKLKGFQTLSSDHEAEWLFDLVWLNRNEDGLLKNLELVLECELSDRNINGLRHDFEKLLISNSSLRIFICFSKGNYNFPNNVNKLLEQLIKTFQAHSGMQKKARLLTLIWEDYSTGKVYPFLMVKE